MNNDEPKNPRNPAPEKAIPEAILTRVRRMERQLLQNIKWISLGIGVLYLLGYIWRVFYYGRFGIPPSLLDFPFPEILVPKGSGVVAFFVWMIFPLSYAKFHDFFVRSKRSLLADKMGITQPVEDVLKNLFRPNSGPNKTRYANNFEAIAFRTIDYVHEHLQTSDRLTDDDWEELVRQLRLQLPDVPDPMKDSMISWTMQHFIREKEEIFRAVDTFHQPPTSSPLFNRILFAIFLLLIPLLLYTGELWRIAFMALGYVLGKAAYKLSYVENRVQFWHVLWIAVILAFGVQAIDASLSAISDVKNDKFPYASVSTSDQEGSFGMLLGFFKGSYFIFSMDEHDFPKLLVIDADHVQRIELDYRAWTLLNLKKLKKNFHKLEQRYDELIRKREALRKEKGDPNFLDDIEITKPVWPTKLK